MLDRHGLDRVPEAHCYLRYRGERIDITRDLKGASAEPIARFLHEAEIEPAQIGDYKKTLHQQFVRRWIADNPDVAGGKSFDRVWQIREECIAALGQD